MSEHDKYIDYDVIYKAELAKIKQQLAIAVEALGKTKSNLLSINIAYLSYNDRNKLYDIMLSDGIIDNAIQQIKEINND